MRPTVGGCFLLIAFGVTGACGRSPLDDQVGEASSNADGAGTTSAAGRVPAQHRATADTCPLFDRAGKDACASDGDCFGGAVCACNPSNIGNRCVTALCRVDSDCGAGGYCGPVINACTREIVAYQCHAPTDKCLVDGDCPLVDTCDAYPGEGWACRIPVACRG